MIVVSRQVLLAVPILRVSSHRSTTDGQASFYARYTGDIVAFADQYTGGKVVSVLEGGYSDLALTSAALGHTVGLLGRKGDGSWWDQRELANVGGKDHTLCLPISLSLLALNARSSSNQYCIA